MHPRFALAGVLVLAGATAATSLLADPVATTGGTKKAEVRSERPRPSARLDAWRDTDAKRALIEYVEKVTTPGTWAFVPVEERIAVFDNDGTLWPEDPMPVELAYAIDTVKAMAKKNWKLRSDPMVDAAFDGNVAKLLKGRRHEGLVRIMALSHAGMTSDEFRDRVEHWLATARHPRFERRYDELTYEPMQEVIRYLRAHDFAVYLVSGGGADFMRVWSERVYGIPPERVIGSTTRARYELRDDGPTIIKTAESFVLDDHAGKPASIYQYIGRRPIMAFGNSDGDKEMLEYTTVKNPRPSFAMLIHHTDAQREYAYDAKPPTSGKLVTALADAKQRRWVVVDMKADWSRVFTLGR